MTTAMSNESAGPLERWIGHLCNAFALLIAGFLLDVTLSGRNLSEAAPCEVLKAGGSALALALALLTLSHKVSLRPYHGAVPITGQTLAICVNGLCFRPAISTAALCLYIALGISRTPALAALGPGLSDKSAGYVLGFLPCAALLGAGRQVLGSWPLDVVPVFGCSVLAQSVVLACGAAWLRWSYSAPLSVTVRPYIPGMLLKSVLAASIVVALGWLDVRALCLLEDSQAPSSAAPCSTPSEDSWLHALA